MVDDLKLVEDNELHPVKPRNGEKRILEIDGKKW